MKKTILLWLISLVMLGPVFGQTAPTLGKNSDQEVISAMSLDEKVRLLVGMGMRLPGMPGNAQQGPVVGQTQDKVAGAAGTTATFQHLGIPGLVVADGPAGLRISPTRPGEDKTYYCTAFPIATLLAASWDTPLVGKVGEAMGRETKEYGVDIILGPGMNLHRNPLGGRNFEYYSEDPLLTGKMAAAMVNGIQSNGVGTSIKHFAVNNHETNRNTINVKVSQRALRELYLQGFEIAVKESNPWTVMSSYNKVNGTYTSQSAELLKTVLRKDWGFKGFVMTDWFGGDNAVEQMKAGNDLLMPGTPKQVELITQAVKEGRLEERFLDENLATMLPIFRQSPAFKGYVASLSPDLKSHAVVARQAATEGMVLLKNDAVTLPLRNQRRIAAFGNHSYDLVSGGTGSGDVNEAYTVSLPEGLQNAGFQLMEPLRKAYEMYLGEEKAKQPKNKPFFLPPPHIAELALSQDQINAAAASADCAIVTIGRIAGEFADRKAADDFYLWQAEQDLLRMVSETFHSKGKKVIVILNVGGALDVASWRDKADAILLAWLPGQEAGNAIADVLTGKVNPSGKLPTTFLKRYEDDPTAAGFPGKEFGEPIFMGFATVRQAEIEYEEGVYMGYRACDKQNIEPAYEFGYGLSYTTFSYTDLKLSSPKFKNKMTVSVTVTNTGKVAGKEVAQLYLSAPALSMDKPAQELKGFAKTRLLQPGESQVLSFELDARALASFDEKSAAWLADKGLYTVRAGGSSRGLRLQAGFKLAKSMVVETVSRLPAMGR